MSADDDEVLLELYTTDTTQSPTSSEENNNNTTTTPEVASHHLNPDANDYVPEQYIEPRIWVGRTRSLDQMLLCAAMLRQTSLTVICANINLDPARPDIKEPYHCFVILRTPLTGKAWRECIEAVDLRMNEDASLPAGKNEDVGSLINQYCDTLTMGDPVLENQSIRRAMFHFICSKYLADDALVLFMN